MKTKRMIPLFVLTGARLLSCAGGGATPASVEGKLDIQTGSGEAYLKGISNPESVTDIVIPSSVNGNTLEYIKPGALAGCKKLKSLTIPFVGLYNNSLLLDNANGADNLVDNTNSTKIGSEEAFGSIFGQDYYEGATLISQSYESATGASEYFSYINYEYESNDLYEDFYGNEHYTGTTSKIVSSWIKSAMSAQSGIAFTMLTKAIASLDVRSIKTIIGHITKKVTPPSIGSKGSYYIPNSLEEITINGGAITQAALAGLTNIKKINIGAGVTQIAPYAFANCTNLESVTINPNCKAPVIGWGAFANCVNLRTINIPNNVYEINGYAFFNCQSLSNVTIKNSSNLYVIGRYAFMNTGLKSFEGPKQLRYIGDGAFAYNNQLKSFTGDFVSTIDQYAFYNCYNLEEVNIPRVCEIGEIAFAECYNLNEVIIEDEFESAQSSEWASWYYDSELCGIGDRAFYDCVSLEKIKIPSRINYIGDAAFKDCESLKEVDIIEATWYTSGTPKHGSGLKYVEEMSFKNTPIEEIVLPSTVYYIGANTFENCKDLKYVSMALSAVSSLQYVGRRVFYNCTSLKEVNLPVKTSYLYESSNYGMFGPYAFKNNYGLESITVPGNLTTIWEGCFENCTNLKSVTIKEGIKYIYADAFKDCTALEEITIPASVLWIETGAFRNCTNLKTVNFADNSLLGTEDWDYDLNYFSFRQSPFLGCNNLQTVHFGVNSRFKDLSRQFFTGTENSLENVIFDGYTLDYVASIDNDDKEIDVYNSKADEDSLTQFMVRDKAFEGFTKLTKVQLPYVKDAVADGYYLGDYVHIGADAFKGCTKIEKLIIPAPFHAFGKYSDYDVNWYWEDEQRKYDDEANLIDLDHNDRGKFLFEDRNFAHYQSVASSAFTGWTSDQTIYFADDTENPNIYWELVAEGPFSNFDVPLLAETYKYDSSYYNSGYGFTGMNLTDLKEVSSSDHIYTSEVWGNAKIQFSHELKHISHDIKVTIDEKYQEQIICDTENSDVAYTLDKKKKKTENVDLNYISSINLLPTSERKNGYDSYYIKPVGPRCKNKFEFEECILIYKVKADSELATHIVDESTLKTLLTISANGTELVEGTDYKLTYTYEADEGGYITIIFDEGTSVLPESDLSIVIK